MDNVYICLSMDISFSKYQGTGNDFVLIDNMNGMYTGLELEQIKHLCNRKFGIGSDGLIMLNASVKNDFYMDFFNPDGSKSFCGNGARCAVKFAFDSKIINQNKMSFEAIDGTHNATVCNSEVKLEMSINSTPTKTNLSSDTNEDFIETFFMDTGSPHLVAYVDKLNLLESKRLIQIGQEIRYSPKYIDKGINVNLVYIQDSDDLSIATYERGVENETLSCGTGATACALIHAMQKNQQSGDIRVHTKGGLLQIAYEKNNQGGFNAVYLIGPAMLIYNGTIRI